MTTLIIDDERLARKELSRMLQPYDSIEIVGEAKNAIEAKELIEELTPTVIFLDIQMPAKNGFELLEELSFVPQVVFTTAFDEFALKAFEVNALDYLLKPIEDERLEEAIKKVENRLKLTSANAAPKNDQERLSMEDRVFVKDGEKCWFVKLKKISVFESMGNYVRVYFDNYKPLILKSLNSLEERLDQKKFFRANRKYIINLEMVENIENWFNGGLKVGLKDGQEIEISRRQAVKFKEMMGL